MEFSFRRRKLDRPFDGLASLGKAAKRDERRSERVMRSCEFRLDRQRLTVTDDRLRRPARGFECAAQLRNALRRCRGAARAPPESVATASSWRSTKDNAAAKRRWVSQRCRIHAERRLEMPDRLAAAIKRDQRIADIAVRRGEWRLDRERAAIAFDRLFVALQRRQRIADVVVRFDAVGIDCQRPLEMRDRFVLAARAYSMRRRGCRGPRHNRASVRSPARNARRPRHRDPARPATGRDC